MKFSIKMNRPYILCVSSYPDMMEISPEHEDAIKVGLDSLENGLRRLNLESRISNLVAASTERHIPLLSIIGSRRKDLAELRWNWCSNFPGKRRRKINKKMMDIATAIGVLSPFPFYYWLWTCPQSWVDLCGKGRDPSKVMAYVAHFLKLVQFISLFSVSTFHWPLPFYFWPLLAFGQFLNFRSLQLLRLFACFRICIKFEDCRIYYRNMVILLDLTVRLVSFVPFMGLELRMRLITRWNERL